MNQAKRAIAWLAVPLSLLALACEGASDPADEVDFASEEVPVAPAPRLREQPAPEDIERMRSYAAEADAVFVGEVVGIEHQISSPDDDGRELPFTLVTWEIVDGIKGVSTGERYSARFLGGPIGDVVVVVDEIPEFQTGDRDLLFVAGNGTVGCPLVDGAQGRVQLHSVDGDFDGLSPSRIAASWASSIAEDIRAEGLDGGAAARRLDADAPFTFAWPAPATGAQMRAAHARALPLASNPD